MAQMLLILGESGTGKSTSMRNCDPATTAIVNPVGKPLPFKGHFDMLNNETKGSEICKWLKKQAAAGKKLLVVDDFQYILSVPYFRSLDQFGWDKWNDMANNYATLLFDMSKDLPDDVVIAVMSHTETLDNGVTTIKLLGKQLREKITIEGLFTIVLMTGVDENGYYFYTQNNGKDTVKSPMGMFPSYAIDNDLQYVYDKICNFYEVGNYKTDAEMEKADADASADLEKPVNGRRARGKAAAKEKEKDESKKSHDEVVADNNQKLDDYVMECDKAIHDAFPDQEAVPFDEAMEVIKDIPEPEPDPVPRRTRKERVADDSKIKEVADQSTDTTDADDEDLPFSDAMNPPEPSVKGRRTRRTR